MQVGYNFCWSAPRGGYWILLLVAAGSTACGDGFLSSDSVLNLGTSVSPNGPIDSNTTVATLAGSPNCPALPTIDVPTGFASQERLASHDIRWDPNGIPWISWIAAHGATGGALHVATGAQLIWQPVGDISDAVGILDTASAKAQGVYLRFATNGTAYVAWRTQDANFIAKFHLLQSDGGAWTPALSDPNGLIHNFVDAPSTGLVAFELDPNSNVASILWGGADQGAAPLTVFRNANILTPPGWTTNAVAPSSAARVAAYATLKSGGDLFWAAQVPQAASPVNGNWVSYATSIPGDGNYPIAAVTISQTSASTSSTLGSPLDASTGTRMTGLAWEDTRAGPSNIYYREAYVRQATVTGWTQLGSSDSGFGVSLLTSGGGARHVSLVLDANDVPMMAYEDVSAHQIVFTSWDGIEFEWTQPRVVSRAASSAWWPRLAIRDDGALLLAWEEDNARLRVCRLR